MSHGNIAMVGGGGYSVVQATIGKVGFRYDRRLVLARGVDEPCTRDANPGQWKDLGPYKPSDGT